MSIFQPTNQPPPAKASPFESLSSISVQKQKNINRNSRKSAICGTPLWFYKKQINHLRNPKRINPGHQPTPVGVVVFVLAPDFHEVRRPKTCPPRSNLPPSVEWGSFRWLEEGGRENHVVPGGTPSLSHLFKATLQSKTSNYCLKNRALGFPGDVVFVFFVLKTDFCEKLPDLWFFVFFGGWGKPM